MTPKVGLSSFEKFRLVLGKNLKLQSGNYWQLIGIILMTTCCSALMIVARRENGQPAHYPINVHNAQNPTEIMNKNYDTVFFSPNNDIISALVTDAINELYVSHIQGFASAKTMEEALLEGKGNVVGIEFPDSWKNIDKLPSNFQFALRFPSINSFNVGAYWHTDQLITLHPPTNVAYMEHGFVGLQAELCNAYYDHKTINNNKIKLPKLFLRQMPEDGTSLYTLTLNSVYAIFFSFMYPCICITQNIVTEKEYQHKELLKINGVSGFCYWFAWYMVSLVLLGICVFIIVSIIGITRVPSTDVTVYICTNVGLIIIFLTIHSHCCICFCFLISALCSNSSIVTLLTLLTYIATLLPYLFLDNLDNLYMTILLCLPFNSAMGYIFARIERMECQGGGLQWDNLFQITRIGESISIGGLMGLMLLNSMIYILIFIYVEQIHSGKYGISKRWYFPCSKRFWCKAGKTLVNFMQQPNPSSVSFREGYLENPEGSRSTDAEESSMHLSETSIDINKPIGIELQGLSKSFGQEEVVKRLTFNMYKGEITVLLGHNGAGKTTTIYMLTGITAPTSGTAIINGYDIRTQLKEARATLGFCPQQNVLFDSLTVAAHIRFYSRLKGVSKLKLESEVKKYLRSLGMENQAKQKVRNLSSGKKRRLSVACAMCGNTKLVFCDEPSCGLDPAARRDLWDLMLKEKKDRTILLTTHCMDEAEILGDRIAILYEGELKTYGTINELKQAHNSGFLLTCLKRRNCNVDAVTKMLNNYVPGIKPDSNMVTQMTYRLPVQYKDQFTEMCSDLEHHQKKLGIRIFGLSSSNLKEIFGKVSDPSAHPATPIAPIIDISSEHVSIPTDHQQLEVNNSTERRQARFKNQWYALMCKNVLYTYRHKYLYLLLLILPVIIGLGCRLDSNISSDTRMTILHDPYDKIQGEIINGLEVATTNPTEVSIAKSYEMLLNPHCKLLKTKPGKSFLDYLLKLGKTKAWYLQNFYFIGATIENDVITAWYNLNRFPHSAPLSANIIYNAMLKTLLGSSINIVVINAPYEKPQFEDRVDPLDTDRNRTLAIMVYVSIISSLCMLFIIEEQSTRIKLQQIIAGVGPCTFWLTHFLWDYSMYALMSLALVVCCYGIADLLCMGIVLLFVGLAALPLAYLCAQFFVVPSSGFAFMMILNLLIGTLAYFVLRSSILINVLMFYPHMAAALGVNHCFKRYRNRYTCASMKISACVGLWQRVEIRAMLASALILALLLIAWEYRWLCFIQSSPKETNNNLSDDVSAEENIIDQMNTDQIQMQRLILKQVTKKYASKVAVNQISFHIQPGECFGLLGGNGAGKTTIFKLVTGESFWNYGEIHICGHDMRWHRNRAQKELGYGPQFNALLGCLTGRELLKIFALLRSVPRESVAQHVQNLSDEFGLQAYLDKQIKHYSSGNKCKLNTALAFGGNSLICLDEPTSGIDPTTSHRIWDRLSNIRMVSQNKGVLLSTNNMDECQALCTTLAIMANGQLEYLGSQNRLKKLIGKGFLLKVKVHCAPSRMAKLMMVIEQRLQEQYLNVQLIERYEPRGIVTFRIAEEDLKLSDLHRYIDSQRDVWQLQDYSVTHSTLEELFFKLNKRY